MKKILLLLSLLVLVSAGTTWVVTGAHWGWTETKVAVKVTDPVTGIEGDSWQNKFVAGFDFLGAAVFVAGTLAGASLLFRSKKPNQPTTNN